MIAVAKREHRWIEIGVVIKAHGLRGAFSVKLYEPKSTTLECVHASLWRLRVDEKRWIEKVSLVTPRSVGALVALFSAESVRSREEAEALRGAQLCVPQEAIPLGEQEYLYADLIGCSVFEKGRELGCVTEVFNAGASDVLVIRAGGTEWMIPLVEPWVTDVDVTNRKIEITSSEEWVAPTD